MNRRGLFKRLGAAAAAVAVGAAAPKAEAEQRITINTQTYGAWTAVPALTFDDLVADCKARGCNLESMYSVERLRYEIAHWLDGERWVDDTMTTSTRDLEPVAAWLDGLHERIDRIHGEAMTATSASFGLYSSGNVEVRSTVTSLMTALDGMGMVFEDRI